MLAAKWRLTVVQLLPALNAGGVERSTVEIAQALVAQGHRAIVISGEGRLVASLNACGAEHICLPIGRKAVSTIRWILPLRRIFKQLRPDIVHARSRLPAWIGRFVLFSLSQSQRPRWITTVHGLYSRSFYSAVMMSGERVICVSETVRKKMMKDYPTIQANRLRVIPRGIDLAYFASSPRRDSHARAWASQLLSGWDRQSSLLILPGRGTRLKGHQDALMLIASLQRQGINAFLWLVGVREPARLAYVQQLEDCAKTLGVAHAVAMSPVIDQMNQVYAASDIVLQLSRRPEAFGRTVLEALSVQRPVVGWDHGGVGELLHRFLPEGAVQPFDHTALSERVCRLLDCPLDVPRPSSLTLQAMQVSTLNVYAELCH